METSQADASSSAHASSQTGGAATAASPSVAAAAAAAFSASPAAAAPAAAAVSSGPATRSLVLDIGGDTVKIGWSGDAAPTRLIPNCAVKHKRDLKWLVGDLMLPEEVVVSGSASSRSNVPGQPPQPAPTKHFLPRITDYSGLLVRRPHDRGFIVNWDLENQVLARAFHRSNLDPSGSLSSGAVATLLGECSILATVPLMTPSALLQDLDEVMLEKWGVKSYRRITPAPLAHRAVLGEMYPSPSPSPAATTTTTTTNTREALHRLAALVVDSGYSFTHVMPLYQGRVIKSACRRINVGGKLLTNYLKEQVSYRAWNMLDETWIINDVKEKLCYVSLDFERELAAAKKSRKVADRIRREYVLPNGSTVLEGFVRTASTPTVVGEQVLPMLNERFTVPEVLFNPSDVGLAQQGVCESIAAAIAASPRWMQPLLSENIVLVGGNARIPNYAARIERELRSLLPTEYRIAVRVGADPVTSVWAGGAAMAADSDAHRTLQYVTKADLAEYGSAALTRKWEGDEDDDEDEHME